MDSTPLLRSNFMVAYVSVAGFTPPVAESNSDAVISRRNANLTASARLICDGRGLPYCSWKLSTLRIVPDPDPEAT